MAELKNAIDAILVERTRMREIVTQERSTIDSLVSLLQALKNQISDTGDKEVVSDIPSINEALSKLYSAQKQADMISERFDRQTVNIGVAGNTHAGKSTLLQSLSGLNDDQIPKAPQQHNTYSTTAVRSEIFNCPQGEERAEIFFRSEENFVSFINDYMKELPGVRPISSKEEFKGYNLDNLALDSNSQEYCKDRLKTIQKSYGDYSELIGRNTPLRLEKDKFGELKQYVSYLYDGSKQYYPAVSGVNIYCNFGNLDDDLQLGLIDLPGFGENKSVDQIMLHGLQTKVDHAIQIFRPTSGGVGIQQKDSEKYDQVRLAVNEIKSFNNFLSFFINRSEQPDIDNLIRQTKDKIQNQLNKKYVHPVFEAPANDREAVKAPFLKIVNDLISTLPIMDKEVYDAYRDKLQLSEVKNIINNLTSKIKKAGNCEDDEKFLSDKAFEIRNNIRIRLDAYKKELEQSLKDFSKKAQEIHDSIEKEAENIWKNCEERILVNNSMSPYYDALNQLKTILIYSYSEEMNKSYVIDLDKIKQRIVDCFSQSVGSLLPNPSLESTIEILQECGNISEIVNAFKWLQDVTLDFRHAIYSYLKEDRTFDKLNGLLQNPYTNNQNNSKNGKTYPDIRSMATTLFKDTNNKILEIIKKNDKTKESFLGIVELFIEIIIRFSGEGETNDKYKTFYKHFRDRIDLAQDTIDWKSIIRNAEQAQTLINKLNK